MTLRSLLCSTLIVCGIAPSLIGAGPSAKPLYRIEPLPVQLVFPNKITNFGRIAGSPANAIWKSQAAYLYQWGSLIDLGSLTAKRLAFAQAANDLGQTVGAAASWTDPWQPSGPVHGFLYSNGKMTDLGTLSSGSYMDSAATAVNIQGQVAGWSSCQCPNDWSSGGGVPVHAFLYQRGRMKDIHALGNWSAAVDMNSFGTVAGWFLKFGREGARDQEGTFVYQNGKTTALPLESVAAINDRGQIVGSYTENGGSAQVAIYDQRSGLTKLGSLQGAAATEATDINLTGTVTGTLETYDPNTGHHDSGAVVFQNGAWYNLNDCLDSSGQGWVLNSATSVNDFGLIVGSGTLNGQPRGFVLIPLYRF